MFQKNPVSKYSTFQNIWFMIKLACTSQEKKVLVISFFIALLTIIQNLLNLYVSPVILSAIENHVSIQELLFTIVIFVLMIMLVSAALAYANQNVICGRISVRCEIVNLLNKKASTTSYPNIDDMKFKKLLTKSAEYTDNNDQATEAIWNTLTVLLINIVCFFIYAGLLTQIHPILILVILSTAGISYFISQRLDEYKYQHREEEAEYIHQMAYLLNRAADFGAARYPHFRSSFLAGRIIQQNSQGIYSISSKSRKCLYLGWNCRFDFYFSAQWSGLRIFNLFGIIPRS